MELMQGGSTSSSSDPEEAKKAAQWELCQADKDLVDTRYASILGPSGYAPRSRLPFKRAGISDVRCLLMTTCLSSGLLTAHEWLTIGFLLFPFLFHNVLDPTLFSATNALFSAIFMLVTQYHSAASCQDMKLRIIEKLCVMEKVMPRSKLLFVFHLLPHICDSVADWGPAYVFSMWSMERYSSMW